MENQSKFQKSVILSKFSKVIQVIYSSSRTSIPNLKAVANILFRYLAHKVLKKKFKGDNPDKGHNCDKKKNMCIYFSAPTSVPNMKALAQILFEISCTQYFQILFSKGHYSEKGHNLAIQKNTCQLFYHEECVYEISKP